MAPVGARPPTRPPAHAPARHDWPARARAGVRHVLQELSGAGHCAGGLTEVAESAANLLDVPLSVTEKAVALK